MKLNLYSAIEVIKGFQEELKKSSGSIVLFSSVAAQKGFTNHTIIATAKAAILGLTRRLAKEVGEFGIRVNAIAPTHFRTPMLEKAISLNPEGAEYFTKNIPLGRLGQREELVGTIVYLSSAASSMVTGIVLAVDGGHTAR